MATRIVFCSGPNDNTLSVNVSEGVDEVFQAWAAAQGLPFALTEDLSSGKVWINPAAVAYWEEGASGRASF